jgi:hypothetical protein
MARADSHLPVVHLCQWAPQPVPRPPSRMVAFWLGYRLRGMLDLGVLSRSDACLRLSTPVFVGAMSGLVNGFISRCLPTCPNTPVLGSLCSFEQTKLLYKTACSPSSRVRLPYSGAKSHAVWLHVHAGFDKTTFKGTGDLTTQRRCTARLRCLDGMISNSNCYLKK